LKKRAAGIFGTFCPASAVKDQTSMTVHKFRSGQSVTMAPSSLRSTPKGRFEIVRQMPEEHGTHQYRIRSVLDGHERIVLESEIE
jgi:hypothetical protein